MRKQFKKVAAASILSALMVFTNLAGYLPTQSSAVIAEETATETETSAVESTVGTETAAAVQTEVQTSASESTEEVTAAETTAPAELTAQEAGTEAATVNTTSESSGQAAVTEAVTEEPADAENAAGSASAETTAVETSGEPQTDGESVSEASSAAVESSAEAEAEEAEKTAESLETEEAAVEGTSGVEDDTAEETESAESETSDEEMTEEETAEEEAETEADPLDVSITPLEYYPSYDIPVKKVWANIPEGYVIPEQVTVALQWTEKYNDQENWQWYIPDGEESPETLTLSADNDWSGTFENVCSAQDYQGGGYYLHEACFRVVELNAGENFAVSCSVDRIDYSFDPSNPVTVTVTNTYIPEETTYIKIHKIWADDLAMQRWPWEPEINWSRPYSIKFKVWQTDPDTGSSVEVKEVAMSSDASEFVVDNLDKYNSNGTEYQYSVTEEEVPNYSTTMSQDGQDVYVTNTEMCTVTINKQWVDGDNTEDRQNIDFTLYYYDSSTKSYKNIETKTLNVQNGEDSVTFGPIKKFYPYGLKLTTFHISEEDVDGYDSSIDYNCYQSEEDPSHWYYTVTNTKTTSIKVKKVWDDNNYISGRPHSITFVLRQKNEDGEYVSTGKSTSTSSGNSVVTFEDLPAYDSDGNKIEYDVIEEMPDNDSNSDKYICSRTGNAEEGYVFTNKLTEVKILKVDATDQSPLEGAILNLRFESNEKYVAIWTSTTEPYVIRGLDTNVKYELFESNPPKGYVRADYITFTIAEDGTVTTTGGKQLTDGTIVMEDTPTSVIVSKVDSTNNKEIAGAHFEIRKKIGGKLMAEWDSTTEPYNIQGILPRETYYVLRETAAPDGYLLNNNEIDFRIDYWGRISTSNGELINGKTLRVKDTPTTVKVSKTDITGQKELAGAHIQITKADGTVVTDWISSTEAHEITGILATGVEYTLHETVAPDGYTIATDTHFTIDEEGNVTTEDGTMRDDGTLLVKDSLTSIKVAKTDITGQNELAGAHIQVLKGGTVVTEWTSKAEAHEITGLSTGVEYTLHETVAPDGCTIASDTHFTIGTDGTVTTEDGTLSDEGVLLVEDSLTSVKVSKVDVTDQSEVEGAHIQILDKDGNVVEEWDSKTEAHEITGLHTGKEYTLRETVAPDGYLLNTTDTHFTIDEEGNVTTEDGTLSNGTLLVEDMPTTVKVSKVDITDQSEVEGAHIQILDKDNKVVAEWDSKKEAHEITGLHTGKEYTLRETVAPDGYLLNTTDTHFTIDKEGNVTTKDGTLKNGTLLVEDAPTTVKVSKVDITDQSELEGAHIQILDKDNKVVAEWDSKKEAHEITGLTTGVEYTLRETVAPDGYMIAKDTHFTIGTDGTVTTKDGKLSSDGTLLVEDSKEEETTEAETTPEVTTEEETTEEETTPEVTTEEETTEEETAPEVTTEEEISTEAETTEEETTTVAETTTTAAETTTTAAETTTQTAKILGIEDNSQIIGWILVIGGAAVAVILVAVGIAAYRRKHKN